MCLSPAADGEVLLLQLKPTATSLASYLPPALKSCSLPEVVVNGLFTQY